MLLNLYVLHFNPVVDIRNALFNVNELKPVLSIFLIKRWRKTDSNQTARIPAPHVSRSYPIWLYRGQYKTSVSFF